VSVSGLCQCHSFIHSFISVIASNEKSHCCYSWRQDFVYKVYYAVVIVTYNVFLPARPKLTKLPPGLNLVADLAEMLTWQPYKIISNPNSSR